MLETLSCSGAGAGPPLDETSIVRIDYIEFPATDMAAMKAFYGTVCAWSFQDWGPDYVSFSGSGLEGGFRAVDAGPPRGGTLAILYADDLEAAERAVTDAGGEIVERHEFPGGRRFQFLDPSGNELAIWTKR